MSEILAGMAIESSRGRAWRRFRRNPLALAGLCILAFLVVGLSSLD